MAASIVVLRTEDDLKNENKVKTPQKNSAFLMPNLPKNVSKDNEGSEHDSQRSDLKFREPSRRHLSSDEDQNSLRTSYPSQIKSSDRAA